MRLRLHRVAGQVREGIARAVRDDLAGHRLERSRVPEEVEKLAAAAVAQHQGQALDGHDRPRGDRHDDQDRQQRLATASLWLMKWAKPGSAICVFTVTSPM